MTWASCLNCAGDDCPWCGGGRVIWQVDLNACAAQNTAAGMHQFRPISVAEFWAMEREAHARRPRLVDACLVAGGMGIVAVAVLVSFIVWLASA